MKCPNCGTENKENYCIKCGTMIMKDGTIRKIQIEDKRSIYDDLEIYIGNHTRSILQKGFNFPAGFITPWYLLYRKCLLEGTILLIIEYLLMLLYLYIFNGPLSGAHTSIYLWISGISYLIHFILFGSITNAYYIYRSKNKIIALKKKSYYDINLLHQQGGVNIFFPIIITLLFIIVILLGMKLGIRII